MKPAVSIIIIALIWFFLGFTYYPKWDKPLSEATISWDVSGYYHYLPAIFIYQDIRQQNWMNEINQKYLPSPAFDQAFGHQNSGNKVNKYAIGQAVLFSPFFLMAHGYATFSGKYPSDGYSKPYQFSIWFGSFLVSVFGLVLLSRILLRYFDDGIVTLTLIGLAAGTHWMEYASITNGMNHTWLFTLLCVLITSAIRFYKRADWTSVVGIGASLGLAVLTRPTEIVWTLVPLLWGITTIRNRFSFLLSHWEKVLAAVIISGLIIFIQPAYWKYASGEWIVYSYGDQGFNWLHPAVKRGLIGANIGWWLYTPLMFLATLGWYGVYKNFRSIFWPSFLVTIMALYITLSWSHFESGGGLGQRNLIQIYPVMAFPLAVVIGWFNQSKIGKWGIIILIAFNIYYSGWWIRQAHVGGFFQAGQMTRAFFLSVVGRPNPDRDLLKLLETNEYFKGQPKDLNPVFKTDFEGDSAFCVAVWPAGGNATCLSVERQFYGPINLPVSAECAQWIRLEADFIVQSREWDVWKYAQWIVQFYQGDTAIKTNFIRIQRLFKTDQHSAHIFFDVRIPGASYDRCTMTVWNADSPQTLLMDNLKVSCFEDQ